MYARNPSIILQNMNFSRYYRYRAQLIYSFDLNIIKLQFRRDESEYVISVIDNGRGFNKESLEKATQKFYSENKARNGTHYGLGLTIVEKIMKEHFGFVRLENLKENSKTIGARVSLVFPLNTKSQETRWEEV